MEGTINKFTSIYVILHPETREIRYVGMTRDPKRRFREHCNGGHSQVVHRWIQNLTSLPIIKIHEVVPVIEGREREKFWISHFRNLGLNLLNQTDGGETGNKKQRGYRGPHKLLSPETREKIRISHLGKSLSLEHSAAIKAGWTEERRAAQSVIMTKIYLDKKQGLR